MPTTRTLTTFILCTLLAGCALPADGDARSTGPTSAPIINGQPSTADEDSAIALANIPPGGNFSGACSGVMISKNIVLTARHCVAQTEPGGVACTKDGTPLAGGGVVADHPAENLVVLTGAKLDFATFRETIAAAPRGKKVIHTGARNLCNADFALVILDKPVTNAPIAQIRLDSPPIKGDKVLAVGWGVSNNSSGYGRRRRADIPITAVGPVSTSLGGAVGPNEFQIGEGICSGDSGGPAYDMVTKAVVGVVSRGGNGNPAPSPEYAGCVDTADYKTRNIYTRSDTFKALILQAFAETGEKPWLEGAPDPSKKPTGETCVGGDECQGGLCIEVSGKRMCSAVCSDTAPCPEAYACIDAGGTNVCAPPPTTPAAAATQSSGGCALRAGGPDPSDGAPLGGTLALAGVALALSITRRSPRTFRRAR